MSHLLFEAPDDQLKSRAVKGAVLTAIAQGLKLGISILSVIVLSRLLTPHDFGVYAMVTPLIGFALLFQEFGLTQAVVTSPAMDQASATGMFRLNLALSVAVAALLAAVSPVVAAVYKEPAIIKITCLLAMTIIVSGSGATHFALLSRGLKFNALTTIEIVRTIAAFLVALVVAYFAPSPFALAAQFLTSAIVGVSLAWLATRWRPSGATNMKAMLPMIRFGAGMTSFNLTNYLSRNADNVMIGWARGATELGLYDRAYKLLLFPLGQINAPVSSVMMPIMARLVQEPARYRSAYLRTLRLTMLVTVPGVVAMLLTAHAFIPLLLGNRWSAAAPIFQWLAVAGLHQTVSNTFGWLFVTQRRTTEYARFGIFSTATCLIAFAAGLPWGSTGVAAAYAISGAVIRLPLIMWLVGSKGPVRTGDIIQNSAPYLLAAGVATGAWWVLSQITVITGILTLAFNLAFVFIAFWAALVVIPAGRRSIAEAIQLLPTRLRIAIIR